MLSLKNAEFGTEYTTKDGRKAIYLGYGDVAVFNPIGKYHLEKYDNNGMFLSGYYGITNKDSGLNLVSRYQDTNKEKLKER